ncbi:MAG TPA: ABC transporter permease [Candidatus Acidoferrales bacterium]|nr:ABC transporter permease [Candidatus Acidoferrales bacterium]
MRWLKRLFRKRTLNKQLDSELHFHIEQQIADNLAAGMPPAEARRCALAQFGGLEYIKEETREARGTHFLESILQDIRYALRTLRKSPGFTAVAVLTLALGIGANTAIFSVVNAVLLQSLPYADAGQLVSLSEAPADRRDIKTGFSYVNFAECRAQNSVFSEMAGNVFHGLTLTGVGEPADLSVSIVTPEMFSLLNAKPLLGRTFASEDGKQGAAPVAIISENLWRSRFSSNPSLIGQSITLDKRPFTVVGVMPANFRFPLPVSEDVWIPLVQDPLFGPWMSRPGGHWLRVIGRLKSGVSIAQAQAEMDAVSARIAKEYPAQNSGWSIRVEPYRQMMVGNVKSALLILLGAVGLILLIACANIANLLLSRATSRAREIAVRIALGAGRARIIRQLLTENAVLGLLGGIVGVLFAAWAVWGLRPFLPSEVAQINSIQVGGSVLIFALALSLLAVLAFGLAPALLSTPSTLQSNINAGGRGGTASRGGQHARSLLAVIEISLAMVLLVAGGLLIRSFAMLTSVSPGFDPKDVTLANISLPRFQYSAPQQWTAFSNELLARLQAQPGLRDTALVVPLPLTDGFINLAFNIVGNPPLPPGESITADYVSASPDYFRVMRIPLLRGRSFSKQDSPSAPRVALISEAFAQRYFSNQDPLARRLNFGFPPDANVSREIVGIVGDVRDVSLSQKPAPMMYVPFAQAPFWGCDVVVRSSLSSSSIAAAIRQSTHAIDKELPLTNIDSFPGALGESVSQERFRTFLLGSFSAIALILAAVGIFGVISYSVSQRTHEIGVRMALGAQQHDVLRLILGQGTKLALFGLGGGIIAAFLFTRLMTSLLYGVSATDPATFGAVVIILLGVALLACYIPARRAIKVDPMAALRHE